MTNPDCEDLVKLADQLMAQDYGNISNADVMEEHFVLLAKAATVLRRLASSEDGVKGEPEPVAWVQPGKLYQYADDEENGNIMAIDHQSGPFTMPLYAAPPADAGMREAFVRVLASLAAAISILERTPKAKKAVASDKMFDAMLDDYRKALEAGRAALTAPGATTKSDVEALAATTAERPGTITSEPEPFTSDSARDDVPLGYERVTDGTTLPGDKFRYALDNNGVTGKVIGHFRPIKPSPSHPSSTRSEVTALADIAKERQRQRDIEGWTVAHDDGHDAGEMASAAACYALSATGIRGDDGAMLRFWPWDDHWWKPTNRRRDLIKAGALIVAEIERLDRLETR